MPRGIPLRTDDNADDLRRLSRTSPDSKQTRRLLALALIYEGSPRHEAARHANVDVQSIRDWVLRFNAEGPEGLIDRIVHGSSHAPEGRTAGCVGSRCRRWSSSLSEWRCSLAIVRFGRLAS